MSVFNIYEFRQRKKRERLLQEARAKGAADAWRKFAGPLAPAHGTARHDYPATDRPQQSPDMPDRLWNLVSDPEQLSGGGEEVIG